MTDPIMIFNDAILLPCSIQLDCFVSLDEVVVDGDDPHHVQWIYEKALKRSQEYHIRGVTYRLTQGML